MRFASRHKRKQLERRKVNRLNTEMRGRQCAQHLEGFSRRMLLPQRALAPYSLIRSARTPVSESQRPSCGIRSLAPASRSLANKSRRSSCAVCRGTCQRFRCCYPAYARARVGQSPGHGLCLISYCHQPLVIVKAVRHDGDQNGQRHISPDFPGKQHGAQRPFLLNRADRH